MKKALLLITLLASLFFCSTPTTTYAVPDVKVVHLDKACWYSTPHTQIFKLLVDNVTHTTFGSSLYIWIRVSGGTIYGPISATTITFDPLTGGWYYEFDAAASGIVLPTPLQTCYDFAIHYAPNADIPNWMDWYKICLCDDTQCDARFDVFNFGSLNIGACHITCNPGYTYTFDYGDGSPNDVSVAPYCVGFVHTFPHTGVYHVCCTASNGMTTCTVCKDVCVTEDMVSGGGGDPNGRSASGNTNNNNALDPSKFELYPIPAENNLKVNYDSKQSGDVNLSITDARGAEVSHFTQPVGLGQNTFKLNIESLTPGVYFIKLQDGMQITTKKFTKTK